MADERPHPFDPWPELRDTVEGYFEGRRWERRACSCGNAHYYKRDNDDSCGTYDCLGGYRFLEADPPNAFRTIPDVWDEAEARFAERGYLTVSPAPVENRTGTTFLTVAGVQAFDEVLFGRGPGHREPALVAQPAVRVSSKPLVGERDGISTSFVNLATVRTDADVEAYVEDVDAWLDLLSTLGLFVSDCSIVVDAPTVEDWGTGEFEKYALRLACGGLELGELGILRGFPRNSGDDLTVVDCGFSLERIAWALTRLPSFAAIVSPLRAAVYEPVEYLDTVRTATLLAAGGIRPGPDGAGYRLRQFVGDLVEENPTGECTELVRYYHRYWNTFSELSDFEATRTVLGRELDRQFNRRLASLPNAPDADTDTEEFLRVLLDRGNSWDDIRAAAEETVPPEDS